MLSPVLRSLRTMRTRRLLATCLAVVVGAGSITAIALAATSGGPVPPPKGLATAVRDALAAPPVQGVSARIQFTDKLIDTSAVQGSDPLLSGATGRLWATTGRRFRLELQSDNGDAQIVSDGTTLTVYDPALPSAYRIALPAEKTPAATVPDKVPTIAEIQKELDQMVRDLSISPAVPSDVAGQAAYTVRLAPRRDGGLLGRVALAWDAANGVPLRAAVYAVGDDTPVLELTATKISFGSVPASTFAVTPPPGVKVTDVRQSTAPAGHGRDAKRTAPVTGVAAVSSALPFSLAAPASLAGMARSGVRLLDMGDHPAALVTYGRGLSGIAVLESAATAGTTGTANVTRRGHDRAGLNLPAIDVDGAPGQVLPTALGTVVSFARGGVQYVVAGSVRQPVAEAAARGL
jgi:outer membrane lipoprotein-sorting protein